MGFITMNIFIPRNGNVDLEAGIITHPGLCRLMSKRYVARIQSGLSKCLLILEALNNTYAIPMLLIRVSCYIL